MSIHTDNTVRSVCDAWVGGEGFTVFAEHSNGDETAEVYGFTGCSDDDELHAFADRAEASDFAAVIKKRGFVDFSGHDWKFICDVEHDSND